MIKMYKKQLTAILVLIFTVFEMLPAEAILEGVFSKNQDENLYSAKNYINMAWWEDYNDSYLIEYISRAMDNNNDVKMAALKVDEARQSVNIQRASELPVLGAGFSPAVMKMTGSNSTSGSFSIPMIASYEIDIFLKNHDKTSSVRKIYEASKLMEKSSYISIAGAVGSCYYNLIRVDKLIEIQEKIASHRKTIYELMKQRNEQGITSTSDLVKAEKAYILADADLCDLLMLRDSILTSLAVLIGDNPENIQSYQRLSYDEIKNKKQIPEFINSEIITQRPDYMASEIMIEKAGIDVKVAKKEFLPSFNIGGLLNFLTTSDGINMSWQNALAGAGVSAIVPVFTGGKRIAGLKLYKNKYEQALIDYQKTNLNALKEVNDSLVSLKLNKQKYDKSVEAYETEKKDYGFAKDKYNQGVISYLDLIQQEELLLSTEKLVVSNDIDNYINQISLYKATAAADL